MSGGLAVAEALGRFGVEGVSSAFYWDYPALDSPAFWAFRAYRNFDGKGGRFLDQSVQAESSDPMASIFASRDADGARMVVVLLDLDPSAPVSAQIDASSCGRVLEERRFVFAGAPKGFAPASAGLPDAGPATRLALPPYSITVLELHIAKEP